MGEVSGRHLPQEKVSDRERPKSTEIELRFWGARGSIPTPVPENLGYGGNTACLEVRLPEGESFIFDGGTGLRELGIEIASAHSASPAGAPHTLHLFLTHFHWDHVQGIPFFAPLYTAGNEVKFYSSHPAERLRNILSGQMATPYFPVQFEFLAAKMSFGHVGRAPVHFGDLRVSTFPMNHPQGASGYRIEFRDSVLIYASDLEHGKPEFDAILREAAHGADMLVYDAQFTPEEYPSRVGWGHSTWLEATRVAKDAGVKKLILFHHDPGHDDAFLSDIVQQARKHFPATQAAREGLCLRVGG